MNQKQPTPRATHFYGISKDLHVALQKAFPSDFEILMAVTRDGNVQVLTPEKTTFVEKNSSTGKCFVVNAGGERDLIGKEIQKLDVPCDSQQVKDISEGKVGVETNVISVTIFKNSGCMYIGGQYIYW